MSRKPSPGFTWTSRNQCPADPKNVCNAQSSLSTAVAETLFWKLKYLSNRFVVTGHKIARYLRKQFRPRLRQITQADRLCACRKTEGSPCGLPYWLELGCLGLATHETAPRDTCRAEKGRAKQREAAGFRCGLLDAVSKAAERIRRDVLVNIDNRSSREAA